MSYLTVLTIWWWMARQSINKGLIEDHGIHAAAFHHARGSSKASLSTTGLGQQ